MRFRVPSPRLRRGLIAAIALLGQLASSFGMPLPALNRKDTSRPFPCMSHSCGCMNIEEFWQSCCCFTNAEKLNWAEANSVWAPDFVREAAQREKPKTKSCCCDKKGDSCCKQVVDETKSAKTTSSSIRWVLGFAAKRCGGQGEFGVSQTAPSIPASAPAALRMDSILVEFMLLSDRNAIFLPAVPAVPPPRIV